MASELETKAISSGIEFEVSEVVQADTLLLEIPYYKAIEALLEMPRDFGQHNSDKPKRTVESCSQYRGRLVAGVQFHPLVAAIHMAFNGHRPLCLSPDMIWLLICQGFANHVNVKAEELRSQFVKHKDKVKIKIRRDDFVKGSPENPWVEALGEFSAEIQNHIGQEIHNLLIPNFSTTGVVERVASEILLLDAMQSYFEYELYTLCGIPKIKLEGTVDDWVELRDRTRKLTQFGLQAWVNLLDSILEEFISAARGRVNKKFWQSIYKFQSASGGTTISGWIITFFPYLKDLNTGKANQTNPLLIRKRKNIKELLSLTNKDPHQYIGVLNAEDFTLGI